MSKVCIVSVSAPRNMVMLSVYTSYFETKNIKYDLVYLDRYHKEEKTGAEKIFRIEYDRKSKISITKGYIDFKKRATLILKRERYDFVIVWGELTASIISGVLGHYYRNRYCVNVRDLFVNKRVIFYPLLNNAIKKSAFTTVSSEKYLEKLTRHFRKYIFVHSYNDTIKKETDKAIATSSSREDAVIRILYLGNIRFLSHLFKLIEQLKNDARYELIIAGTGSELVSQYIEKNNITNVEVFGTFDKEKTSCFLCNSDVIYNLYGTEDINLRYALSNKLYYAISLGIPILVYKDTYMYEISKQCGIGFAVDEKANQPFADKFFEWYQNWDKEEAEIHCKALLDSARKTQSKLYSVLDAVIN